MTERQMERARLAVGWELPTSEDWDALKALIYRVEWLTNALYAVNIAVGMETWDDLPQGSTEALLDRVERAMQARELNAFLRGLRSGNASRGVDPDELPVSARLIVVALLCHPQVSRIMIMATLRPDSLRFGISWKMQFGTAVQFGYSTFNIYPQ